MIADESASESEEGENYFVSMTDMMVGVLFIFIIMLMIFALDFRTKTDVQDNAIDVAREVARKLDDLQKDVKAEIATMDRSQETRRKLLTTLKSELKADGMDVQIDEANGVLRLTEDAVQFDASQSILLDRAKFNVGQIARVLEKVIPDYVACRIPAGQNRCRAGLDSSIETVFIEGHTNSTGARGGDDRYNWQLSAERSVNTYREIVTVAPACVRYATRAMRRSFRSRAMRPLDRSIPNETREAWAPGIAESTCASSWKSIPSSASSRSST